MAAMLVSEAKSFYVARELPLRQGASRVFWVEDDHIAVIWLYAAASQTSRQPTAQDYLDFVEAERVVTTAWGEQDGN